MNRSGMSEPITPRRHTVGVRRVPGRRYRVRRSRTEAMRSPEAASSTASVSVHTLLLPSSWSSTEVRRMSPSPAAQRPITYHGVSVPSEYVPFSSTWIQVPSGSARSRRRSPRWRGPRAGGRARSRSRTPRRPCGRCAGRCSPWCRRLGDHHAGTEPRRGCRRRCRAPVGVRGPGAVVDGAGGGPPGRRGPGGAGGRDGRGRRRRASGDGGDDRRGQKGSAGRQFGSAHGWGPQVFGVGTGPVHGRRTVCVRRMERVCAPL